MYKERSIIYQTKRNQKGNWRTKDSNQLTYGQESLMDKFSTYPFLLNRPPLYPLPVPCLKL